MSNYRRTLASPFRLWLHDWLRVPLPSDRLPDYVIMTRDELDLMRATHKAVCAELEELQGATGGIPLPRRQAE